MMDVLVSLALIVLTVVLISISMTVKHLSDEIDELKDGFEFHKKIHKYERLILGPKIKEFVQRLDQLASRKERGVIDGNGDNR